MIRLHNTLTRNAEELAPANADGVFRMYECGLTPTAAPHIGHARTAIVFDTLKRWLRFRGMKVMHVRNVTDVEDKIINKAREEGITPEAVVAKYDAIRVEMYSRLNLVPPEVEPYASRHVGEIIDLIKALEAKGLTYAAGGDVLFRVRQFAGYGKLSGNRVDNLQPGARIAREDHAEDPLDFALWKGEKPGEPAWDSPWGRGRPGWHIECSAMSMKYLGETFDLHGGGHDLVFPHHENEIAQSEGATGKPFARIWSHPGWVTFNREKMSKSLGNVLPMQVVLDRLPASALRLLVCQTHYRSPFEWSDDAERQAKETLDSLGRQLDLAGRGGGSDDAGDLTGEAARRLDAFDAAMDDDLGTPRALAELFALSARIAQEKARPACAFGIIKRARDEVLRRLDALGIRLELGSQPVPPEIGALVREREEARRRKDWKRADELRAELKRLGWTVEDSAAGPVARRA